MIADLHLNPNYAPNRPFDGLYCEDPKEGSELDDKLDELAHFGQIGCDIPVSLADQAMRKMSEENQDLDFLLVPGDVPGHSFSNKFDKIGVMEWEDLTRDYEALMAVHELASDMFEEYFPEVPTFQTFGNNEDKYHYQPIFDDGGPTGDDNGYERMYKLWFEEHSANYLNLTNLGEIEQTMKAGGWYRAELIPGHLTLISFNSLQFNEASEVDDQVGYQCDMELDWMERTLEDAREGEKFLLMVHIYETAGWNGDGEPFVQWKENDHLARYVNLLYKYRDIIIFEATGHDHLADLRIHEAISNEVGVHDVAFLNKVLFPGLTSHGQVNPGYATFEYNTDTQ